MLGLAGDQPELPPLQQWPSYREVRRFCRRVVRATGVEPPLELGELCAAVGKLRGRRLSVHYRALRPGLFGFSFPSPTEPRDFILAADNTSRLHQEHIVLHELGHVLAGHLDESGSTAEVHSGSGDAGQEREWVAESIATVLAERALLYTRRFGERPADPASRALDEALRSGGAWI